MIFEAPFKVVRILNCNLLAGDFSHQDPKKIELPGPAPAISC